MSATNRQSRTTLTCLNGNTVVYGPGKGRVLSTVSPDGRQWEFISASHTTVNGWLGGYVWGDDPNNPYDTPWHPAKWDLRGNLSVNSVGSEMYGCTVDDMNARGDMVYLCEHGAIYKYVWKANGGTEVEELAPWLQRDAASDRTRGLSSYSVRLNDGDLTVMNSSVSRDVDTPEIPTARWSTQYGPAYNGFPGALKGTVGRPSPAGTCMVGTMNQAGNLAILRRFAQPKELPVGGHLVQFARINDACTVLTDRETVRADGTVVPFNAVNGLPPGSSLDALMQIDNAGRVLARYDVGGQPTYGWLIPRTS